MRLLLVALFCTIAVQANSACRQALALGLDVSGSVDATEYRLQLDGLATALTSPAVTQALIGDSAAPVYILVFEWSGAADPVLVLPWTEMRDAAAIADAALVLRTHSRGPKSPTTALGAAIETGLAYLDQQPNCWTQTLDISGDGQNNDGFPPNAAYEHFDFNGITVNGLAIGGASREIEDYFAAEVIHGPGAFVEYALNHDHFAEVMQRKLERELRAMIFGGEVPPPVTP